MGERNFRVGLVDDEEGFRNSFADALESQRLKVVFSRPDSTRILDDICEHKPDVVLLDVAMPREDGMRALRRIRSNAATATTRVLMLTVHNQSEMIVEALSKGKADGYLVKSAPLGVIFSGITQTARGGAPLVIAGITESGGYNRSLAQILFEVQAPLTEREMQIARLRARHFRSIDIARDLNIGHRTVHRHVANIKTKLNYKRWQSLVNFNDFLDEFLRRREVGSSRSH